MSMMTTEDNMSDITEIKSKRPVEVVAIVDASGSMGMIRNDAIGAFNTFITDQQKLEGEANLTVVQFSSTVNVSQNSVNLSEATLFDTVNYVPNGGTALFDAIGTTVTGLIARREKGEIDSAIITILTDGEENQSREYNASKVKTLIEKVQNDFGWEVVFLAANQDAFTTGSTFGISAANAVNFTADSKGIAAASATLGEYTRAYRSKN